MPLPNDHSLVLSDEVRGALACAHPVVALETSILAHGLPYPQNIEAAFGAQERIRQSGAIPATIAMLNGKISIGLSDSQLECLGTRKNTFKLSGAELSIAVATRATGATTVAATMICASLAGISVMATGGIGGVHRDYLDTSDVSQDLLELSRTPVIVVASGVKAILDIPRTLQFLETLGVPVAAYRSGLFPAFWSRTSNVEAPMRIDQPSEIARAFLVCRKLKLPGGILIANPVPEDDEIPEGEMEPLIEEALCRARSKGIDGKRVTPFLLDFVANRSGNRTVQANIALVRSNATLAAMAAVELSNASTGG